MIRQMLSALRQQDGRIGMVDYGHKHSRRTDRAHLRDLAHHRISITIAAHRCYARIGETRRHVEGESSAHAREEFCRRERGRCLFLHQANSRTALASAIAKNSPPDVTPNIALPPTSRSSPSATRS